MRFKENIMKAKRSGEQTTEEGNKKKHKDRESIESKKQRDDRCFLGHFSDRFDTADTYNSDRIAGDFVDKMSQK